jgi:hypothetical protein
MSTRDGARRVLASGLAVVALSALAVVGPPPARADASVATLSALTNQARAAAGVPGLSVDGTLSAIAGRWAATMAAEGRMRHNPNLTAELPGGWQRAAENVGMGSTLDLVFGALMNSANHRRNILDAAFDRLGVGLALSGGRVYTVQVFVDSAATPSPPPPPPTPPATAPPAPPPTRAPVPAPAPPAPAPAPAPPAPAPAPAPTPAPPAPAPAAPDPAPAPPAPAAPVTPAPAPAPPPPAADTTPAPPAGPEPPAPPESPDGPLTVDPGGSVALRLTLMVEQLAVLGPRP